MKLLWTMVTGVACTLLLILAWVSLRWPMEHDAPLLFYIGHLIEQQGRLPYRDIFEVNLPAVFYLHAAWGRWFGAYGDLGFRLLDLAHLAGILIGSMMWTWRFGRRVAIGGAALFGIWYLAQGTRMSLQREYMILLPLVWALVVADSRWSIRPGLRGLVLGLLFGCAASIKPTVVVALPWVYWMSVRHGSAQLRLQAGISMLGGLAILGAANATYLVISGTLQDFSFLARNYWPLYGAMNKRHELMLDGRATYLLTEFLAFGRQAWWLLPMGAGTLLGWRNTRSDDENRHRFLLLLGLAGSFLVYVLLAGKFWVYHWLPFMYFACQLAALSASEVDSRPLAIVAAIILLSVSAMRFRPAAFADGRLLGGVMQPLKGDRVERLTEYLLENVGPGQTVQPLDTSGGAIDAMLKARVPLATRFVYDFQFYHHVHLPFIQELRKEFLEELELTKPDFIIEIRTRRATPSGPRTTPFFPELRAFLREYRTSEMVAPGVSVYRRRAQSP